MYVGELVGHLSWRLESDRVQWSQFEITDTTMLAVLPAMFPDFPGGDVDVDLDHPGSPIDMVFQLDTWDEPCFDETLLEPVNEAMSPPGSMGSMGSLFDWVDSSDLGSPAKVTLATLCANCHQRENALEIVRRLPVDALDPVDMAVNEALCLWQVHQFIDAVTGHAHSTDLVHRLPPPTMPQVATIVRAWVQSQPNVAGLNILYEHWARPSRVHIQHGPHLGRTW